MGLTAAMNANGAPKAWHPMLIAAVAYAGAALYVLRVVWPAPTTIVPYAHDFNRAHSRWLSVIESDQKFVVAIIARNARMWLENPRHLFDGGQCYPTPRALTFGEHMLGDGLLGIVPYYSTHDPILTYNAVATMALWLAAVSMFALVYAWTGSASAAFLSGLAFGFHPTRILNLLHPYMFGNHWTPLALLATHRLFTRRRWRDVAALATFGGLQLLESFYALLAFAIIGGTYGGYLLWRYRRSLGDLAPKLAVAFAALAAVAVMVLGPYLETRAAWEGILQGRQTSFYSLTEFMPGHAAYPGTILLALVAVAIADRIRRPRSHEGYDPRWAFLVGGLLCMWAAVDRVTLPGGLVVPSLLVLASRVVPGVDAVRLGGLLQSGVYLAASFLAGWGALRLTQHASVGRRIVLTGAIAALLSLEVLHPLVARRSFGQSVEMDAHRIRPSEQTLALYRSAQPGPVLDLVFRLSTQAQLRETAERVLLSAYHQQPVAACYNSFGSPLEIEVDSLAAEVLHSPEACDALHALGFRQVVTHAQGRSIGRSGGQRATSDRLAVTAENTAGVSYRLESSTPVLASFAALTASGAPPRFVAAGGDSTITVEFRNHTGGTYRHPDPIQRTHLRASWYDQAHALVSEQNVATVLPLALGSGAVARRTLPLTVPTIAGDYELSVALLNDPSVTLVDMLVRVQ